MTSSTTYVRVAFWILVVVVGTGVTLLMAPFLSALLWATSLSILVYPLFARWRDRTNPTVGAILATSLVTFLIIIPFAAVGTIAGLQVSAVAQEVMREGSPGGGQVTTSGLIDYLERASKPILQSVGAGNFDIKAWLTNNGDEVGRSVVSALSRGAQQLVVTVVSLAIAIFTMFFMLRDGPQLLDPVCEMIPLPREKTLAILQRIANTVRSVFVGVLLVAILQGAIAGATYFALGIPGALIWTVLTIVLCTIPLLGAPIIYIPLAGKLFLEGQTIPALILLGVGFGIVSQVDNLLRPLVIGIQTKMHYLTVFFSLLGGVLLFGAIGVMAGPMLVALAIGLTDVIREVRREGEQGGTPAPAG